LKRAGNANSVKFGKCINSSNGLKKVSRVFYFFEKRTRITRFCGFAFYYLAERKYEVILCFGFLRIKLIGITVLADPYLTVT